MGDYFDSASRPYDAGVAAERSRVREAIESEEMVEAVRVQLCDCSRGDARAVLAALRSRLGLDDSKGGSNGK